jgi:hypothetical protein
MTTKTFSLDNNYYNLIKNANPKIVLGARFEPLGVDEFYWNYNTGEISRHKGSFYRRTIVSGGTELQIAELQHHEDEKKAMEIASLNEKNKKWLEKQQKVK